MSLEKNSNFWSYFSLFFILLKLQSNGIIFPIILHGFLINLFPQKKFIKFFNFLLWILNDKIVNENQAVTDYLPTTGGGEGDVSTKLILRPCRITETIFGVIGYSFPLIFLLFKIKNHLHDSILIKIIGSNQWEIWCIWEGIALGRY